MGAPLAVSVALSSFAIEIDIIIARPAASGMKEMAAGGTI